MDDRRSTDLTSESGQHDDAYDNRMILNRSHTGLMSPSHDSDNWQRMPDQNHSSYNNANMYNGQLVDDQFSEHESNVAHPLDDRFSDAESSVTGNVPAGLINASHNGSAVRIQPVDANDALMVSRGKFSEQ
jgi:hypothetical protein